MARRKEPRIPDHLLDQLLAGADVNSQTPVNAAFQPGGLRDQLNVWISTQVGQGLLDDYIDPNPYVEDPAKPGCWLPSVVLATDLVHPAAAGHQAAAIAVQAWARRISGR